LTVLERLGEVANGANDIVVAVEAEREDGYKAEGKPRMSLDDPSRIVSTVVALA